MKLFLKNKCPPEAWPPGGKALKLERKFYLTLEETDDLVTLPTKLLIISAKKWENKCWIFESMKCDRRIQPFFEMRSRFNEWKMKKYWGMIAWVLGRGGSDDENNLSQLYIVSFSVNSLLEKENRAPIDTLCFTRLRKRFIVKPVHDLCCSLAPWAKSFAILRAFSESTCPKPATHFVDSFFVLHITAIIQVNCTTSRNPSKPKRISRLRPKDRENVCPEKYSSKGKGGGPSADAVYCHLSEPKLRYFPCFSSWLLLKVN